MIDDAIDAVYRAESRRVLATLIRLLGDFDLAGEAMHDAFRTALEVWPVQGTPDNPRAWLISTGRFQGIDAIRRRSRFQRLGDAAKLPAGVPALPDDSPLEDDPLRLIFICCHPALAPDAQIALTLREVCGLTTEAIAHAFLTPAPTIAQRIVRAKAKIRVARIPYEVPGKDELPRRLDAVLRVIYLVFNEGYSASSGPEYLRTDLLGEAIRLARLLLELQPEPETIALLALLLLTDSRRAARTTADGEIVLLEDQDRGLWNRGQIEEGITLVRRALSAHPVGRYGLQAAIAAVHAEAARPEDTDWAQIVGLYDLLFELDRSPVVALNRAVAVAMRYGPAEGLTLIEGIFDRGDLREYHLAHAAHADLLRRLGRTGDARAAYDRAITLTRQEPERRFLRRRLAEITASLLP